METPEILENLQRAKRLILDVQVGCMKEFLGTKWYRFLSMSLGYLTDSINQFEKDKMEKIKNDK